jgi:tRNA uridine 5-carboxymethylaminomethyl modification enzyme
MFTSRAEYRVLLRQDNADLRLTEMAYKLGLAKIERMNLVNAKKEAVASIIQYFKNNSANPEEINTILTSKGTSDITQKQKYINILLRPQIEITDLQNGIPKLAEFLGNFAKEHIEQASIQMKYEGYVQKEQQFVEKMNKLEDIAISDSFDYSRVKSLSNEARAKLNLVRPKTLGQASRISGVSPADISVLMIYLGRA